MKKCIPTLIVGMVVLCGLEAGALPLHTTDTDIQTWKVIPQTTSCNGDELDQYQTNMNWGLPIGRFQIPGTLNYIIAQSFKPTKPVLTRVEINIGKNTTTTYDYTVAIRDNLSGPDIRTKSIHASDITTENFSWIEFDFKDLIVTPGKTYYIVSSTVNATDNWYGWAAYTPDSYPNGTIYVTTNDEATWNEESNSDLTFKTYGAEATALDIEISGLIGVKISVKNIGSINASNVEASVSITGGILGLINLTLTDNTSLPLQPGNSFLAKGMPLGLGPITVVATARAENAVEVSKNVSGFILFFFVILK